MKARFTPSALLFLSLITLSCFTRRLSADYPKEPVTIKLDGAKMAPVAFSHATHVEKVKVDCAKCHHKDAQSPKACITCDGSAAKGSRLWKRMPSIRSVRPATKQWRRRGRRHRRSVMSAIRNNVWEGETPPQPSGAPMEGSLLSRTLNPPSAGCQ